MVYDERINVLGVVYKFYVTFERRVQKIKPRTVNPPHLDDVYISIECNIFYKVFFLSTHFFPSFSKGMGTGNLDWYYIVLEIMYMYIKNVYVCILYIGLFCHQDFLVCFNLKNLNRLECW